MGVVPGFLRDKIKKAKKTMANEALADEEPVDGETGENAEGEEGQEGKKGKLKLMIIAGGALVLVLGLAAGAYFMFFGGAESDDAAQVVMPPQTFFYELPEMTVNLSTVENNEQFLKLTVALEVASEEMVAAIEPRVARVIDAFQVYLRELRRSDLEGSAGIYRLKEELRRRVNLALYPVEVQSILFKEILVQ